MKRKTFLYHFLFWLGIYVLWIAVFHGYSFTLSRTMTVEFCYLIFITADYYAINNFLLPRFLFKRKYAFSIAFTIIIIFLSALLRALLAVQMNIHFFHAAPISFSILYLNSVINISFWVLIIITGKMLIERMQTQQKLEMLEKERIKNELDYLKAQINPHALFNSLNTIYGHIDKTNQVARNTLLQFSELLRYQLYYCSAEKVSLEKEIEYIKNYITFQCRRKDENLCVETEIEITKTNLEIAPLLLIVLIENAFKFASNFSDKKNKIVIKINIEKNVLNSSFINTIDCHQNISLKNSSGIGITNLRRRLELLYAEKYELRIKKENEFYKADLNIDLS